MNRRKEKIDFGPKPLSILLLLLFLLLGLAGHARSQAPPASTDTKPSLIALDDAALAHTHQRIQVKDPTVMPAFVALQRRADHALQTPLRSVINKSKVPPSGSKNDYMSMGPYWWPNPATSNGLPYIQRDGQVNPETKGAALDASALGHMVDDSLDLALAYRFTNDVRYATKAAAVIRTWFLTPETRMNPSLRFAQAIPGVVDGRGIGLIDTRYFVKVMDAMTLIGPALKSEELQGMRRWFADYAHWFKTSDLGHDEAATKNNHGLFYDMQMVALWLFLGETERARTMLFNVQTTRFAAQIDENGRMPLELERTRPYHYSVFALHAATQLARYGQVLAAKSPSNESWPASDPRCKSAQLFPQCPLDLWNVVIDGKSLRGAIDVIAQIVIDPSSWKYATALEKTPILAPSLPVLLQAQQAYPSARYAPALAKLQTLSPDNLAWLLYPLP